MEKLAILGGEAVLRDAPPAGLFDWPIFTHEDEAAVLDVLRTNRMSGTDITQAFEAEFAAWVGCAHAIGYCNGTLSLQAAMYAAGLGPGDELIAPSKTYWASVTGAMNLGATVVFADIDPNTLCLSATDIERVVGPRSKAVMVVHYLGHPADMDAIMAVAAKHKLIVIEDFSHAQGGFYKGRRIGSIGHIGATSLMAGKSFAVGEMGMLVTDDKALYDRAVAYCHYERNNSKFITTPGMDKYFGLPVGGMKGRVNQMASAIGRVQLKYYDERTADIRAAMNAFWDALEGVPGLQAHRVTEAGSDMGGWYAPHGIYHADQLHGVSCALFCAAVRAEGYAECYPGGNAPLHTHPLFCDPPAGPNRLTNATRDVAALDAHLPVTMGVDVFSIPWLKKPLPEVADYAAAYAKVARNAEQLVPFIGQSADQDDAGRWYFFVDKD